MDRELLRRCEQLADEGTVIVATADGDGLPHVAAAGKLDVADGGRVTVTEWFCPGTVSNVQENSRISVVAWNPAQDDGAQLLGTVTNVRDVAMLDGYAPDEKGDIPQTENELVIEVESVLKFTQSPHTDEEK